jgi:general secretion pathway protein N
MPASVAVSVAKPYLPKQLKIGNVSGSVWAGAVTQVIYKDKNQQQVFKNLKWSIQASSLFYANLVADINFGNIREKSELSGKGSIQFGLLSNELILKNTNLRAPINDLLSQANLPLPVNAKGRVTVKIEEYELGEPYCEVLNANITTQQLEVQGLSGWFSIDEIAAKGKCKSGNITFAVNKSNDLGLQLDVVLAAKNKLTVSGFVKPSAKMPKDVHDAVKFLGRPDNQGRYAIKL